MFDQKSIVVVIVTCMCLVGSMTVGVKRKAIAGILGNTELKLKTAPVAPGHSPAQCIQRTAYSTAYARYSTAQYSIRTVQLDGTNVAAPSCGDRREGIKLNWGLRGIPWGCRLL